MEENKQMTEKMNDRDSGETFDDLIRGTYKEQFDRRVQKILDGRLKNLRQENERLREAAEGGHRAALAHLEQLEQQAEEIRRCYPNFDWQQEMKNATYGTLIAAGIDGRTAYEMVHRDRLRESAVEQAARRATGEVARAIASGGSRVTENGGRSVPVIRGDPRNLTSRELAEIRNRVRHGEKIKF